MNWKKIGLLTILTFLLISPLMTGLVLAQDKPDWLNNVYSWSSKYLVPEGIEAQIGNMWTAWIIGILATVVLWFILFDVANLAFPFSKYVNIILVCAFTLVALLVGMVRAVVSFGLGIGALLAGTAGTLALILSGILFIIVILALFIGGQKLTAWAARAKGQREVIEQQREGWKDVASARRRQLLEREGAK